MPKLETRLIQGAKPSAETLEQIRREFQIADGAEMNFMVFEVCYDENKYYCCWSGGEVRGEGIENVHLTPVGAVAMEALARLPLGNNDKFLIQELQIGETPLRAKVIKTLEKVGANGKICFVLDMESEIDKHMREAFNLVSNVINVPQPGERSWAINPS